MRGPPVQGARLPAGRPEASTGRGVGICCAGPRRAEPPTPPKALRGWRKARRLLKMLGARRARLQPASGRHGSACCDHAASAMELNPLESAPRNHVSSEECKGTCACANGKIRPCHQDVLRMRVAREGAVVVDSGSLTELAGAERGELSQCAACEENVREARRVGSPATAVRLFRCSKLSMHDISIPSKYTHETNV